MADPDYSTLWLPGMADAMVRMAWVALSETMSIERKATNLKGHLTQNANVRIAIINNGNVDLRQLLLIAVGMRGQSGVVKHLEFYNVVCAKMEIQIYLMMCGQLGVSKRTLCIYQIFRN